MLRTRKEQNKRKRDKKHGKVDIPTPLLRISLYLPLCPIRDPGTPTEDLEMWLVDAVSGKLGEKYVPNKELNLRPSN